MHDIKEETGQVERGVLFRFSLYGFLKNQRYFEPFILLAFVQDKGLSFFQIGILIAFRELWINLLEIPSGAIADLYGRRRSMVAAFISYTVSFIIFGFSDKLWHLFAAMFMFAVADAFRTGTHKAIIFDYLKSRNCEDKRVQIYGYTRSWSKIGSAVSAIIAAVLVFWTGRYSDIFWLCAIPSMINIINFMGYPRTSDKRGKNNISISLVFAHVWETIKQAWHNRKQRSLLLESSGFEGVFKISKDYLQVVIKASVVSLPILASMEETKKTAVLIGVIYSIVFLLSGFAARQGHLVVKWKGSDDKASLLLWAVVMVLYGILVPSLLRQWSVVAIIAFMLIYLAQNIYRPLLVSRLNSCSEPEQAATTLSIESQMKSLVAMVIAPLLGLAVDNFGVWTVGVLGLVVSIFFWLKCSQQTKNAAV